MGEGPVTNRTITAATAQLGPIQKSEPRAVAVQRMIRLMEHAHKRGVELVVFPELALTTCFPRHYHADITEADHWFETVMPSNETAPLSDAARRYGIGFHLGCAELVNEPDDTGRTRTIERSQPGPRGRPQRHCDDRRRPPCGQQRARLQLAWRYRLRPALGAAGLQPVASAKVDLIMFCWGNEVIAHTIVSFGFDDGTRLAFSILGFVLLAGSRDSGQCGRVCECGIGVKPKTRREPARGKPGSQPRAAVGGVKRAHWSM